MQPPRLTWVFEEYPVFFLTLVSYDRKVLFANRRIHGAFIEFGERAVEYEVAVGRYVLMPDHIHLFAAFGPTSISLSRWIKSLKNALSKSLREQGHLAPHWQKGFTDHVLRREESYAQKWEYVRRNPVAAKLVADAEDWEFQGEICRFEWVATR